jgi:hypothetical protein
MAKGLKKFVEHELNQNTTHKIIITYDIDSRDKEFYTILHEGMKKNFSKLTESTYISNGRFTKEGIETLITSFKNIFKKHRESMQDTTKITMIFADENELIVETIVRPPAP